MAKVRLYLKLYLTKTYHIYLSTLVCIVKCSKQLFLRLLLMICQSLFSFYFQSLFSVGFTYKTKNVNLITMNVLTNYQKPVDIDLVLNVFV